MILIATIDELLDKVDSKYTLVHLSARRAREINAYYHSLGEGIGRYTPPLVESSSNKPLSIALEEIAAEKIVAHYPGDAREEAEELLGGEAEGGDVLELVQALTGAPGEEPEIGAGLGDEDVEAESGGADDVEDVAFGDAIDVSDIPVDPLGGAEGTGETEEPDADAGDES